MRKEFAPEYLSPHDASTGKNNDWLRRATLSPVMEGRSADIQLYPKKQKGTSRVITSIQTDSLVHQQGAIFHDGKAVFLREKRLYLPPYGPDGLTYHLDILMDPSDQEPLHTIDMRLGGGSNLLTLGFQSKIDPENRVTMDYQRMGRGALLQAPDDPEVFLKPTAAMLPSGGPVLLERGFQNTYREVILSAGAVQQDGTKITEELTFPRQINNIDRMMSWFEGAFFDPLDNKSTDSWQQWFMAMQFGYELKRE